jgi:hypothetical protein
MFRDHPLSDLFQNSRRDRYRARRGFGVRSSRYDPYAIHGLRTQSPPTPLTEAWHWLSDVNEQSGVPSVTGVRWHQG